MDLDSLHNCVERAAERYTNATVLYQWAHEKGGNGGFPPMTHRYPDVISTYGGSCIEQLKAVEALGFPLRFLRSTRVSDTQRSLHYAAVCCLGGKEYLVDPNLCAVPVALSEVREQGEASVETFPAEGEQRTQFVVRRGENEVVSVQQVRKGKEWAAESYDLQERLDTLPGVEVDILSPLSHQGLILHVALPSEGRGREVVRIRASETELSATLLAAGRKIPKAERGACLDRIAEILQTNRERLEAFFDEAWQIYERVRTQREEIR